MKIATPECCRHGHDSWRGLWFNVGRDIERQLTMSPESETLGSSFKRRLNAFLRPEIQSLFLHRLSHHLHVNGRRRLGSAIARFNFLLHKVNLSPQSCIGPGCRLPHPAGVVFHGRAGTGLTLFSLAVCCPAETGMEGPVDRGPTLGDRVLIGAHAVLLGPVTVGSDTKVPYSVRLDRDAPSGVIVLSRNLRLDYRQSGSESSVEKAS